MTTRTITCLGDWTSSTSLIIASVSQTKITRSPTTSSRVLSYRKSKLCKKKRINIWICRSPYLQWRPSWVTAHAQFYQVTFMVPKYHSLDAPRSLGRKSVFCTFLCVLYRVCNARSAFKPEYVFYTQSVMRSPRFIPRVRVLYPVRSP